MFSSQLPSFPTYALRPTEVWDGEAAAELLRMLEYCREDEIHHKEEARGRAAEESRSSMGHRFDAAWRWLVMTGSDHAANLAKRF